MTEFIGRNVFKIIILLSLVRSRIEYAFLIWHSNSLGQSHKLSLAQDNFLEFFLFRCHVERIPHIQNKPGVEGIFNLPGLKLLKTNGLKFLFKLLYNVINVLNY